MPTLQPKESKNLKKGVKRTLYFLVVMFFFCLLEAYLLQLAGLNAIWNGVTIIATLGVMYLIFIAICARIDKKRETKRVETKHKDPFSR